MRLEGEGGGGWRARQTRVGGGTSARPWASASRSVSCSGDPHSSGASGARTAATGLWPTPPLVSQGFHRGSVHRGPFFRLAGHGCSGSPADSVTARAQGPSLRSWLASGMTPPEAPHPHHHTPWTWTWPARTGSHRREAQRCAASIGRVAPSGALLGPSALAGYSPSIIFLTPHAIYTQLLLVPPENTRMTAAVCSAAAHPRS